VAGARGCGYEPSGPIKCGERIVKLNIFSFSGETQLYEGIWLVS
jgi:hypothetical protein